MPGLGMGRAQKRSWLERGRPHDATQSGGLSSPWGHGQDPGVGLPTHLPRSGSGGHPWIRRALGEGATLFGQTGRDWVMAAWGQRAPEDPGLGGFTVDRPPLPSRQKRGGFRCGCLCNLPGTQHHGPAPGDRSAIHDLRGLHGGHRDMAMLKKAAVTSRQRQAAPMALRDVAVYK